MRGQTRVRAHSESSELIAAATMRLARDASIEINVQDSKYLELSRQFLNPGQKLYVSHLPGQSWESTETVCSNVADAGFDPVPHLPVRLVENASTLDHILSGFISRGKACEVLLLSGDYPQAVGPYSSVSDVLAAGFVSKHGLKRISVAGHPEGHPKVPLEVIRHAEREKAALAQASGIDIALVTQFFFESAPFLSWVNDLRNHNVSARVIGGVAGPAGLSTLFKFAMRCGVGPSIRALGIRPSSFAKLLGDHDPNQLIGELANALAAGTARFDGLHLFCFGGFLRTCEWLQRTANGQFNLDAK